ncbi:protein VACUOLELESS GAMETOPHYTES-like [Phragmites australis]|uniref:protein VACUOLELESS GAMETOPHYTES-like n=1 Tax=Phragmites australis TaxID=29695 RepID=UPI002D77B385|nr:protein VACUOLELESS GAMETOPHYTES-like [Phragmites australis]
MAPATARSFFHPQHLVVSYNYDGSSTYDCAACKRIVTGTGYRCDECDFNIHEACFSLPRSISFDQHPEHKLTLIRLTASRCCDVCKGPSHDGSYLYRCVPCSFDVHPRCMPPLDDGAQPQQQQPPPQGQERNVVSSLFKWGVNVGIVGFRVVDDVVTGGSLSPVLDAIQMAADAL